MLCGLYAFFNLTFPPRHDDKHSARSAIAKIYLTPFSRAGPVKDPHIPHLPPAPFPDNTVHHHVEYPPRRIFWNGKRNKPNEKRSRVTFSLLVLLAFAVFAVGGAVVGSAVIGYALAGLWRAGKYNMSTFVNLSFRLVDSYTDSVVRVDGYHFLAD